MGAWQRHAICQFNSGTALCVTFASPKCGLVSRARRETAREVPTPSAATEKTAARIAEAGRPNGRPHEREGIMVELLIVGLIVGVLAVKGWKRAMHRRLIKQRLRDWCQR